MAHRSEAPAPTRLAIPTREKAGIRRADEAKEDEAKEEKAMVRRLKAVISRPSLRYLIVDPGLLLNGKDLDLKSDGQAQVLMDRCKGIEPAQDQEQEAATVVNRPENGDSENVGCAKGWSLSSFLELPQAIALST